jgi:hypothetical protein
MREKYCWLITDGWFVLREKVPLAGKSNKHGA